MNYSAASGSNRMTLRLVLASTFLGLLLLATLILCVGWVVNRIDNRSLAAEKASLTAAFQEELQRLSLEQDSSAEWDDAVAKVRERDQTWIAENLAEWMSDFFGHSRVYVIAPDNSVIRAAQGGQFSGTTYAPLDVGVLLPRIYDMRKRMAEVSAGLVDSTTAIVDVGVAEVERHSRRRRRRGPASDLGQDGLLSPSKFSAFATYWCVRFGCTFVGAAIERFDQTFR